MPGRGVTKVEYSDKWQQWLVLDGTGAIVDMKDTREMARRRSVEFAAQERTLMGIMGNMRLWPQRALAEIFGVSTRTIRDAMEAMRQ